MLVTQAPAKVNWTLEVLGRRDDGYHEIASVMSTISLRDRLVLDPADDWRLFVDVGEPLRSELETGDNLIARAVAELARSARPDRDVTLYRSPVPVKWRSAGTRGRWAPAGLDAPAAHFRLTKGVPVAAGLGGGSSDAAAALRLLSRYWKTALAANATPGELAGRLAKVGARIGSDVPFFVHGGTQLATGRGERLRSLHDPRRRWLVLLTPPLHAESKTARLYGMLTSRHYTDGRASEHLAQRLAMPAADIREEDVCNVFEDVAADAFPGIATYREHLSRVVGAPAHLCGAGPSLFALASGIEAARQGAARLRAEGLRAWAVRSVGRAESTRVIGMPAAGPPEHSAS